MKITKKYLQNIVKEELQGILREQADDYAQLDTEVEKEIDAPARARKAEADKIFNQFKNRAESIAKKHGLTPEQGVAVVREFADQLGKPEGGIAGIVQRIKGGSAAPKPGRDMGQPTTTKTVSGDAAVARLARQAKQQAEKAGLTGKHLAGYLAQNPHQKRFGHRKRILQAFLKKQQAGG